MRSAALHCQEESAFIRARMYVCVCVCMRAGSVGAKAVSATPSKSARGSEGPIGWTFCLSCCHMLQQGENVNGRNFRMGIFETLFLSFRNVLKLVVVYLGSKTVGLFELLRDMCMVWCRLVWPNVLQIH